MMVKGENTFKVLMESSAQNKCQVDVALRIK